MKVENHGTTKLKSQHENLLERKIQRMRTNIKLCLTTTCKCTSISSFYSYCKCTMRIYLNYKIIENI